MQVDLELTPDQESHLARLAHHEGVRPEELLRAAALRMLRDDEEHMAAIEMGIAQADRGELIDHAAVLARLEQRTDAK